MAINPIDNLVNEVLSKLPQSADALREDMNSTLKASLSAALKKMDLVTRDEFDIQRAVLEKTRAQLKELETRLAELEKHS
ncbi:MAG: accessory factor UbiK family protein [Thioalkalispiraceae bacterium]|jgi:BMFP domain-containing protein YqiC